MMKKDAILKIQIAGKQHEMTIQQARELHEKLIEIFGGITKIISYPVSFPVESPAPINPWYNPWQPTISPTIAPPWIVTCKA